VALDGEVHRITRQRIQRARETLAALDSVLRERSAESIASLHDLHARHLRELGDEAGAVRAEQRAARTRADSRD
jgi:hypothetical protein